MLNLKVLWIRIQIQRYGADIAYCGIVRIDGPSENMICPLPGDIPGAATLAHKGKVLFSEELYT
jgi:hypothetical protein